MKNKTKKILITMKENIKLINVKYIKILIIFLLILYILSYVLIAIYSFTFEKDKIAIDRYNFEQLEKAKPILETIGEKDERFFSLNEFNERYSAYIKPIKNCYYLNNNNGKYPYIFGFKLESLFYSYIYGTNLYSYPGYDQKIIHILPSKDINNIIYFNTISNKCEGSVSGYIYRDENKNGIKDDGEIGFEGLEVCAFGRCLKTGKTGYYNFSTSGQRSEIIVRKYYKDNLTITYPLEEKYDVFLKDGEIIKNLDFGIYN